LLHLAGSSVLLYLILVAFDLNDAGQIPSICGSRSRNLNPLNVTARYCTPLRCCCQAILTV